MEDLPASHPLYGSEQSKSGFGICYQFAIKCPVSALRPQCFQGFAGFVSYSHSVGAAVLCGSGAVYTGVNVYSLHGACAEQVAIGAAAAHGEHSFLRIVAVRGVEGKEILPPCGNCRQMLADYAPDCQVILANGKIKAENLLPFAYQVL